MKEVKTYAVNCNDAWLNTKGDDISGSYVKYADYLELAVQLTNSESKCRELAAENANMKECTSDVMKHVYRSKTYLDSNRIVDAIQGLQCAIERKAGKTPATDAVLAEVRAQGVEMFAHDVSESEQGNGLMKAIGRRAIKFAAQLRKGAAL